MIAEAIAAAERVFVALMLLAGLAGGMCGLLALAVAAVIRQVWVRARDRREGRCTPAEGTQEAPDGNLDADGSPSAPQAPPEPSTYKEAA